MKQMDYKYNKDAQEHERLENHKFFYSIIKKIAERDFVISSANPLNHITSLQNKIEMFIKTEKGLIHGTVNRDQRIRDAEVADQWLLKVFNDLIESGMRW